MSVPDGIPNPDTMVLKNSTFCQVLAGAHADLLAFCCEQMGKHTN
jgi:hypothetical protein